MAKQFATARHNVFTNAKRVSVYVQVYVFVLLGTVGVAVHVFCITDQYPPPGSTAVPA